VFINPYTYQWRIPGVGTCVRKQIPLRLGWAITHHRSQGKTLTNVKVDPRAFAYGQAYVAVSRSRSMKTLTLLQQAKLSDFTVNPAVRRFMQYLEHPHPTAREEIGHWLDETLPWSASKWQSTWPRSASGRSKKSSKMRTWPSGRSKKSSKMRTWPSRR